MFFLFWSEIGYVNGHYFEAFNLESALLVRHGIGLRKVRLGFSLYFCLTEMDVIETVLFVEFVNKTDKDIKHW